MIEKKNITRSLIAGLALSLITNLVLCSTVLKYRFLAQSMSEALNREQAHRLELTDKMNVIMERLNHRPSENQEGQPEQARNQPEEK